MLELVEATIDLAQVLAAVQDPRAGASLLFVGTTREYTGDQRTTELHYECYPAMARQQLQHLAEQARRQWPLTAVALVHRLGPVPIGEASVAIAVSAPHRAAAFSAGQWLLDTLKQQVAIWKREQFADGTQVWQHPDSSGAGISATPSPAHD